MPRLQAPDLIVQWWNSYRRAHRTFPFEVSYHPRSDEHSKVICQMILDDLMEACPVLTLQANRGEVCFDVNHVVYRRDGTEKKLDLVVGQPQQPKANAGMTKGTVVTPGIRVALEAKACMTKHASSRPRLRDELMGAMNSAYEARPDAILGGIVVVNIAESFLSPTHQPDPLPKDPAQLRRKRHKQPRDAASVIEMLERLPIRRDPPEIGFDSLGIVVVSHDNEIPVPRVSLVCDPPCPPTASPRSYGSFVIDLANKYQRRFG